MVGYLESYAFSDRKADLYSTGIVANGEPLAWFAIRALREHLTDFPYFDDFEPDHPPSNYSNIVSSAREWIVSERTK